MQTANNETDNMSKVLNLRLTQLIFDERVADMVEELGGVFPDVLLPCIEYRPTYKMSSGRVKEMLDTKCERPISVKQLCSGKYSVLNGRHRLTTAILQKQGSISAIVEPMASTKQT
jgi:hypothetical protein